MLADNAADGSRTGAHDDRFRGDAAALAALDALEQRAVGNPGRGEDAVALGHVLEEIDAVEVLDPPAPRAPALVVVAEQQAALDLPADTGQRGGREHALGRAARSHVNVDRGLGIGGGDDPGDVAVGDQHDPATDRAQLGDHRGVARAIEHAGNDLVGLDALGGGETVDVVGRRLGQVDRARGVTRPDRDLVHVDVGGVEQPALLGNRQHRERVGAGLGGDRRSFERVERDVDPGAGALRAADLFADIEHRRFVALALADDHGAVHRQFVERGAHRLDRGGVGGFLVAAPDQLRRGDCRRLGDPHHFHHEDAVED